MGDIWREGEGTISETIGRWRQWDYFVPTLSLRGWLSAVNAPLFNAWRRVYTLVHSWLVEWISFLILFFFPLLFFFFLFFIYLFYRFFLLWEKHTGVMIAPGCVLFIIFIVARWRWRYFCQRGPLTGAEWVVYSRGSVLERCAKQFVWFLCQVGMIVFRVPLASLVICLSGCWLLDIRLIRD